jgi:hypothetical protein
MSYQTAPVQCRFCGDTGRRNQMHFYEGRKVIASRNANKQVSPDTYGCEDCHAAGEYKQFLARVQNSFETHQDLSRPESYENCFAACLAVEARSWAPVLAKKGGKR